MSVRFSVVVPVHNDATNLKNCIASLKALDYPPDRYEIIVVDNHSTDASAAVAAQFGVTCLPERESLNSYAARNRGVQAAKAEFIAFTNADCIVHSDWLKEIDAVAGDGLAGCFAGEILPVKPATTVERFGEKMGLRRQRASLSGFHLKPYAQTVNAVYRKVVFDRVGLFDTAMPSGADAVLAWRMLDKTSFTIRFVPQAIVYQRQPAILAELFARSLASGAVNMAWALSQKEFEPPSIPALGKELVDLFGAHVKALETAGVEEQVLFSALTAATKAAYLSGYLQDLLSHATYGEPMERVPEVVRLQAPTCNICGSRSFVPGPNGRLFNRRPPKCRECGALERHRMLYGFISDRWKGKPTPSFLCVGEGLPTAANRFAAFRKTSLADLSKDAGERQYDAVLTMNVLGGNPDLADALEHLVLALHDKSILLLYEPTRRNADPAFEQEVFECLPNTHVSTAQLRDAATGDSGVVTVVQPDRIA